MERIRRSNGEELVKKLPKFNENYTKQWVKFCTAMNSKLEALKHHFWAEKLWSSKPSQTKEKSHPKWYFFALLKPLKDFSHKVKVNTWFSHVLMPIFMLKSGLI